MEAFKRKGCFCKLSFEKSVCYFSMSFRGISRANLLLSVKHFKVSSRRMHKHNLFSKQNLQFQGQLSKLEHVGTTVILRQLFSYCRSCD